METKCAHLKDKSEDFSLKKDWGAAKQFFPPQKLLKWAPEVEGRTLLSLGTKKFEKGCIRGLKERETASTTYGQKMAAKTNDAALIFPLA